MDRYRTEKERQKWKNYRYRTEKERQKWKNFWRIITASKALAKYLSDPLQRTAKVVKYLSIVQDCYTIGKAIYEELTIDDQIEALKVIVACLEEDLRHCSYGERAEKMEALRFARAQLEDAYDCKQNPGKKTALTLLCIAGSKCGSAALAYAGAKLGGVAGGMVGGPGGAAVGAAAGYVFGTVVGSELGASAMENLCRNSEDGIGTRWVLEARDALTDASNNEPFPPFKPFLRSIFF